MDSTIERRRASTPKTQEQPDLHEKVGVVPAGGLTRREFNFALGAFLAGLAGCAPRRGVQIARDIFRRESAVRAGKTIGGYIVEDVDYSKILAGKQVLVIGDVSHTMPENVEELAANVKQFKKNGVTHIALEALKAIHQKEVDAFLAGKISDEEIAPIIKADWHFPRVQEPYLKLLKACKKEDIKVIALDLPDRGVYRVEGYPGMEAGVARNYVWANRMMPILEEKRQDGKKPKIVVFGGTFHTRECKEANSVTQLLKGEGIKVESAVIVVGDPRELDDYTGMVYSRSIELGLSERRFMVSAGLGLDHNFMIYVPSRFQDHLEMQLRKDEKTLRLEGSSPRSLQNDLTVIQNPQEIPGFTERMSRLMNDKTIPPKNRVAIIKGLEFKSALAHSEVWQTALKHAAEDADSEVREAAKKAVEYIK